MNLTMTGKVSEPNSEYCSFVKSINEQLVKIYLRLNEDEIAKLWGQSNG